MKKGACWGRSAVHTLVVHAFPGWVFFTLCEGRFSIFVQESPACTPKTIHLLISSPGCRVRQFPDGLLRLCRGSQTHMRVLARRRSSGLHLPLAAPVLLLQALICPIPTRHNGPELTSRVYVQALSSALFWLRLKGVFFCLFFFPFAADDGLQNGPGLHRNLQGKRGT